MCGDEIEVTDEMIQVGMRAQMDGSLESLDDEAIEKAHREELVRVYRAMPRLDKSRKAAST
jgi:hypothetical protein